MPSSSANATAEDPGAVTLIDASALIALLADEPAADAVEGILREGAAITAVNLAEAVDRLGRRYALDAEQVRPVIEGLLDGGLDVLPVASGQAWRAAEIRSAHYHRTACPISLADAVLIACAGEGDDRRTATSDTHVLRILGKEGHGAIPLPDSTGRRPG